MSLDMSRGLHWIGHPGSLGWIVDRGEEQVEPQVDTRVSEPSMGGGVRVRESRTRPHRAWQLTVPNSHADEVAHVESLIYGALGPYQLVTARAQVSNVLTPDRSLLRSISGSPVSVAGGWPKEGGGWTTFTGLNPAAAGGVGLLHLGPCPAPPVWTQRKVTASVWLATSASSTRVVLRFLDAAGVPVGAGYAGSAVTGMDALRRSHVTATVPWGAVACRIELSRAEVLAEPQVTWTDHLIEEWSVGKGADRVSITGWGESTSLAVPGSRALRRGDYTLSLVESGPAS